MSIELDQLQSGNSGHIINRNFQTIQEYINDYLLRRFGTAQDGDNQMEIDLDMNGNSILNLYSDPNDPNSVATVGYVDGQDAILQINIDELTQDLLEEIAARQAGDAYLQSQLLGEVPLEGSAFSPISWHEPRIQSSISLPEGKNAWSFGPTMTIESGVSVTVPEGTTWTVANGEVINE